VHGAGNERLRWQPGRQLTQVEVRFDGVGEAIDVGFPALRGSNSWVGRWPAQVSSAVSAAASRTGRGSRWPESGRRWTARRRAGRRGTAAGVASAAPLRDAHVDAVAADDSPAPGSSNSPLTFSSVFSRPAAFRSPASQVPACCPAAFESERIVQLAAEHLQAAADADQLAAVAQVATDRFLPALRAQPREVGLYRFRARQHDQVAGGWRSLGPTKRKSTSGWKRSGSRSLWFEMRGYTGDTTRSAAPPCFRSARGRASSASR
jgi:hypothetical protein